MPEREETPDPLSPSVSGRVFEIVDVTAHDLERASQLGEAECPRRYCWWWRSLAFEWEVDPALGCTWGAVLKPSHWEFKESPCCRCNSNSDMDQYEPRGRHIEMDGADASLWLDFRKRNHDKFTAG